MNQRTAESSGQWQNAGRNPTVVGSYLHNIDLVPREVRDYALNKLNATQHAGNRIQDSQGKPATARISTAKENGSYYGSVILNNDNFIVQAVGRERLSAVVHHKIDVALQGASLAMLDAKKTMNGASIQVHYTGATAKAYPWADKARAGHEQDRAAPPKGQVKEPMKADEFMRQAADYARENIRNTNQREAFLKHLANVTEQAFNTPQSEAVKTTPALSRAK